MVFVAATFKQNEKETLLPKECLFFVHFSY